MAFPNNKENIESPAPDRVEVVGWQDDQVEILLNLWEENLHDLVKPLRNGPVFQKIAVSLNEISEKGPQRNEKEVREKIKNLKKQYRRETKNCSLTCKPSKWRFFPKLHSFLSTLPPYDTYIWRESKNFQPSEQINTPNEVIHSDGLPVAGTSLDLPQSVPVICKVEPTFMCSPRSEDDKDVNLFFPLSPIRDEISHLLAPLREEKRKQNETNTAPVPEAKRRYTHNLARLEREKVQILSSILALLRQEMQRKMAREEQIEHERLLKLELWKQREQRKKKREERKALEREDRKRKEERKVKEKEERKLRKLKRNQEKKQRRRIEMEDRNESWNF